MRLNRMMLAIALGLPIFALNQSAGAHLHPGLGRFVQRDPAGYVDGTNLTEYELSAPMDHRDPAGLETALPWWIPKVPSWFPRFGPGIGNLINPTPLSNYYYYKNCVLAGANADECRPDCEGNLRPGARIWCKYNCSVVEAGEPDRNLVEWKSTSCGGQCQPDYNNSYVAGYRPRPNGDVD